MSGAAFDLTVLPGRFAVARLAPEDAVPAWAHEGIVSSVTRTPVELSILCAEDTVPTGTRCEPGWVGIELLGPFPFDLTGVLASVLDPLRDAGVPILALSTFDTDYVFVPGPRCDDAFAALRGAGHRFVDAAG